MTSNKIKNYIYSGNATFTLHWKLKNTESIYTYNVTFDGDGFYNVYLVKENGKLKMLGKLWPSMSYPFDRTCKEYGTVYLNVFEEFVTNLQNNKIKFYKGE